MILLVVLKCGVRGIPKMAVEQSTMERQASVKAWLFQFKDDSDRGSRKDRIRDWKATRHWKEMGKSDVVFFWQAGSQGGLSGWGTIANGKTEIDSDGSRSISVIEEMWLDRSIPPIEVFESGGIDPDNSFRRSSQGTNFRLSAREARILINLLPPSVRRPAVNAFIEHPSSSADLSDPIGALLARLGIERATQQVREALRVAANYGVTRTGRAEISSTRLLFGLLEAASNSDLPREAMATVALRHTLASTFPKQFQQLRSGWERKSRQAGSAEDVFATNNVRKIITWAHSFDRHVPSSAGLSADGLLASILCKSDSHIMQRFVAVGIECEQLLQAMEPHFVDRLYAKSWLQAVRSGLAGEAIEVTPEEGAVIATLRPDVIPENPRTHDRLNLRRFSNAIGALIAASKQQPPLSIGVFGPWGSGKSFFMKMIAASVEEYAGNRATAADGTLAFKQRIVSIWFNAWHYVGGNLWASLVHAILFALQKELSSTAQEATFEDMLKRLGLQEAAKAAAEEELRAAETRLAEANAALQQSEAEAAARRAKQNEIPDGSEIVRKVWNMTLEAIRPQGGTTKEAWVRSLVESAEKVATYLGRPDMLNQTLAMTKDGVEVGIALQQRIGSLEELLEESRATAARGASALGWLANAHFDRRDWMPVVWLGVPALLILFPLAIVLEHWGANIAAAIAGLASALTPVLAAVGVAIAWAKRHLSQATRAFAVLEGLRKRVEQTQARELAERDTTLLIARQASADAESEVARRRADAEAACVAMHKSEADVRNATSAERLMRFVAQRLADGDYQKHLGLVHTIRSDMERLQSTLKEVHSLEPKFGSKRPIERIVLYIDDLDRCPPARVVEVLEAVHLLLAFPLFVVVVGVDVRWVSQALRDRYPKQLGHERHIASPTDYLEKVFQIPFQLPAMDSGAGRRLLELALDGEVARAEPTPLVTGGQSPLPPKDELQPEPPPTPIGNGSKPKESVDDEQEEQPSGVAAALTLEVKERERLLNMAQAVGISPRRTKRFANLYRLLKASLSLDQRRTFLTPGGDGGTHVGALILLAAATGAPHAALRMIECAEREIDTDPAKFLARIVAINADDLPESEREPFQAVKSLVEATADKHGLADGLHAWADGVQRFFFDRSFELKTIDPDGTSSSRTHAMGRRRNPSRTTRKRRQVSQ